MCINKWLKCVFRRNNFYIRDRSSGEKSSFWSEKKDIYHICWPKNFGDFEFELLSVQMFQLLIIIYKRVILCSIIGDVHQFIGQSLIPLDPLSQLPALLTINLELDPQSHNWLDSINKVIYLLKSLYTSSLE